MASGSGDDSRTIAGQEPTPISQLSDQDAQQHPGNARGEHQGQGTASSCAVNQDGEDDCTLLDSITKVLPNFQNTPWGEGTRERTRYENVSLVGREFSERASTTPEPNRMHMAPRTLPQAPVQAALKAPPPIVEHIDQQLAAALSCMASCEQKYDAAREAYAATYNSWKVANAKILSSHCQRHGEQQSKRQKTRG